MREFVKKHLLFQICYYYYSYKQFILGITITKETHTVNADEIFLQNEYCLNIWLGLISFHFRIFGKKKHARGF